MSRLVKGATGVEPAVEPRRVVPAVVADAHQEAARVLSSAEAQADQHRSQAARELQTEREAALGAERARGHAEAAALLLCAEAERSRRLDEVEQELPDLIREVARRILGRELAQSPAAVVDVVLEALRPLRNRRQLTLRLAPDDVPALQAAAPLVHQLCASARVELVADPTLERGGCVLETEVGRVDARLSTQLDRLMAAVLGGPPEHG